MDADLRKDLVFGLNLVTARRPCATAILDRAGGPWTAAPLRFPQ